MYLSSTYSNTTNYIIFRDNNFVKYFNINKIQWSRRNYTTFTGKATKILGEDLIKDFYIKYDFSDRGFVIGYYNDKKDGQ